MSRFGLILICYGILVLSSILPIIKYIKLNSKFKLLGKRIILLEGLKEFKVMIVITSLLLLIIFILLIPLSKEKKSITIIPYILILLPFMVLNVIFSINMNNRQGFYEYGIFYFQRIIMYNEIQKVYLLHKGIQVVIESKKNQELIINSKEYVKIQNLEQIKGKI